ncbi:MAG: PKD domain-containing protein [Vicingaceae bacterium]|nr:PKD domain-containing protein [Vicingaceae bacterium]
MVNKILILFSCLILITTAKSQTVIWTEDFQNNCASACLASGYAGTNGAWTITNIGANDPEANEWFVSGAECGNAAGACGSACASTDPSLHVGNVAVAALGLPADNGAAYNAGGLCGSFFCVTTDKRAESPTINLTGQTNITLNFNYIENGDGTLDDASLWYFDGATWTLLDPLAKPPLGACTPQGLWTSFSIPLPASANNNANVKIGFRWINNDDGIGNDPSFAVDDITLTIPATAGPNANFTTSSSTICVGDSITFTDASTTSGATTYNWTFTTGTPGTANTVGPHTVVFNTAGTHNISLTVTDVNGTDNITLPITVNPLPTVTANASATSICSGDPVTLTGGGATSYTWDNGVTDGVAFNPTTTTTYTVTGTDGNNCSNTAQVTVTVNNCSQPTASFTSSADTICTGNSITFTDNSTGSGITSWSWTFPTGTPATANTQGPHTVVFNTAGTHNINLQITDANGTHDTTIAIVVNNCAQPQASFIASADTICMGDSITFTDNSTGSGINTWNWTFNGGNPLIANTPGPHTVSFNNAGSFNITLQINYPGGSSDTTITIVVDSCNSPIAAIGMNPSNGKICKNGCVEFSYNGSGGKPTSWVWTFEGAVPDSSNLEDPGLVCWPDTIGKFVVTLEVTNAYGTSSIIDTITVSDPAIITAYSDTTITFGTNVTLTAQATDTSGNIISGGTYTWSPINNLTCVLCQTTTVIQPTDTSIYIVAYEAENGCIVYDTVTVNVDMQFNIGVPSAFTPNGDGTNDLLLVRGEIGIESLTFSIYNRYGQEVFFTSEKTEGWDGTHNSNPVNPGVFVYYVKATMLDGTIQELKGNVTLIR